MSDEQDCRTPNDGPFPGRWVVLVALADGKVQRHSFPWRGDLPAHWMEAWTDAANFVWLIITEHRDWTVQAVVRERWSPTLDRYGQAVSSFISPTIETAAQEESKSPFRKRAF